MFALSRLNVRCSNVRLFLNVRKFECSDVRLFECSHVRMFNDFQMFDCSMFKCSLIRPLGLCSFVRMFAEHGRTFEHWTQMFDVRWPLLLSLQFLKKWIEYYRIHRSAANQISVKTNQTFKYCLNEKPMFIPPSCILLNLKRLSR